MSPSPSPLPPTDPAPPDPGGAAGAALAAPVDPALPPVLWLEPWPDPLLEQLGHEPTSEYVEWFWLSILGPSTTLLLRLLGRRLATADEGLPLDLSSTAQALGIGHRLGKNAPVVRSIDRLVQFGLARRTGSNLQVRCHIPPLTLGQINRLPPSLRVVHDSWASRTRHPSSLPPATDTRLVS